MLCLKKKRNFLILIRKKYPDLRGKILVLTVENKSSSTFRFLDKLTFSGAKRTSSMIKDIEIQNETNRLERKRFFTNRVLQTIMEEEEKEKVYEYFTLYALKKTPRQRERKKRRKCICVCVVKRRTRI